MQIMLLPLRKRFRFHFFGNKQTNSLDKPEWYFTQILTWIRDHRDFLEEQIQPLLPLDTVALVEFSRGLVTMAMEKMEAGMSRVLYDDSQFCHLVDESLAFHRDLSLYDYPRSLPSPLLILCQKEPFTKWLLTEKKNALDRMDVMLSSSSAWRSQYQELSLNDNTGKVPECAETFMTLITSVYERFRELSGHEEQDAFVRLLCELLEDYRLRLVQVKTQHQPLTPVYSAVLNTVTFTITLLHDWQDDHFFVALHQWKCEKRQKSGGGGSADGRASHSPTTHSQEKDGMEGHGFEGSVFDEILHLLGHLQTEMLADVVSYVTDDVQARSKPYRKDKWLSVGSAHRDQVSLSLSTSACEMILVLSNHLHLVDDLLNPELFTRLWQKLAANLDHYFYHQLILANHFSEAGAAQLNFDMTRNFFPLFGQYTTKPENHFKSVKEACIVLTLNSGAARLIKQVLYEALHSLSHDHPVDPVATLHDVGVYRLLPEDVELVLSLRTDLSD